MMVNSLLPLQHCLDLFAYEDDLSFGHMIGSERPPSFVLSLRPGRLKKLSNEESPNTRTLHGIQLLHRPLLVYQKLFIKLVIQDGTCSIAFDLENKIRCGGEPTCLMTLLPKLSFPERTCSLVVGNRRSHLACLTHRNDDGGTSSSVCRNGKEGTGPPVCRGRDVPARKGGTSPACVETVGTSPPVCVEMERRDEPSCSCLYNRELRR